MENFQSRKQSFSPHSIFLASVLHTSGQPKGTFSRHRRLFSPETFTVRRGHSRGARLCRQRRSHREPRHNNAYILHISGCAWSQLWRQKHRPSIFLLTRQPSLLLLLTSPRNFRRRGETSQNGGPLLQCEQRVRRFSVACIIRAPLTMISAMLRGLSGVIAMAC